MAPLLPCGKASGSSHARDGDRHTEAISQLHGLCGGGGEVAGGDVPAAERGKAAVARCGA